MTHSKEESSRGFPLTSIEHFAKLSLNERVNMKGKVRTHETCPICKTAFENDKHLGFICKEHQTRPKKLFIDIYWSGKRRRLHADNYNQPIESYSMALRVLERVDTEIKKGSFDPTNYKKEDYKKFYISNLLDSFLEYKLTGPEKIAPSYRRNFKRFVRISKEHFGINDIRDLRKRDIMEFHAYLDKAYSHYSQKSFKNVLDFFKSFMNYQKDMEIVAIVPSFPKIHVQKPEIITLSPASVQRLYSNVPDADKPIFTFLLLSGMRLSEGRSLKVKDVSIETGLITVRSTFSQGIYREIRKGKASKPAIIPIHPELLPYLTDRVEGNLPEAFVFINKFGEHYKESTFRKIWYKVRDATGIDKSVAFKDATRHSAATNLLDAGVPIYSVSKLLGHSSVKVTEAYYAHTDVHKRKIDIEHLSLVPEEKVVKLKAKNG
jgi:integrase